METLNSHAYMPSSRQSRMAIDSLLNPPDHHHHHHHHHASKPPSMVIKTDRPSPRLHYAPPPPPYSPLYPPSPNHHHHHHHLYSPYSDTGSSTHLPSYRDSHHHHHHSSFLPYRPRSADSSPGAYSRDRYDSVSSSSSNAGAPAPSSTSGGAERRRPPRPKYEEEEMYFIWYHRVDLCQEWKEVRESFNRQFPHRQRRGFQGIQCKFYRFIKEKKCPTLREQRRLRDGDFLRDSGGGGGGTSVAHVEAGAPRFGVVEWVGVWYPWMRENKEQVLARRISA